MTPQMLKLVLGVALTVCVLWTITQCQQLGPCSEGLQNELPPTCFDSNGVDYNGFLYIITSNRTGKLPDGVTYTQFQQSMCQPATLDKTIPCILKQIQKWNKTECTEQDRLQMAGRGGQIYALMEGFCGEPCENAAMQTLIQCFAAVKVDPSPILNPNASIISDKYVFVGNDTTSVTNFCNSRQRLFSCLSPIGNDCPKILERLYVLGIDLEGLELATGVLCDDPKQYLEGLTCFQKGSPALTQCEQQHELAFIQVQEERFITGNTIPSAYQGRLCEAKLSQVDCQLKGFAQPCGDSLTSLRSSFECASLPKPCKEGASTKDVYNKLCNSVATPSPGTTVRPKPPTDIKNPITPSGGSSQGQDGGGGAAFLVVSLQTLIAALAVAAGFMSL